MKLITDCPCGQKKSFMQCCGRFLGGKQHARTPEQLMRSRYSAYALGGYGNYLLETWFPPTSQGLVACELSERAHDWCRLDVLNKSQQGDDGEVEFKAYFRNSSGEINDMHECSAFKRIKGCWYYVGGRVR